MPLKERDMISTSDPRVCMIGHPAPAWMVNYADLMTELVCFFIVLYALSAALNKDVQQAKKDVEEKMKKEKVSAEVKVTKEGMQITLEEKGQNIFFESGSSEMTPRMEDILSKLGPTLKKLGDDGHEIIVEGHTDNIPIHNAHFLSNWELSTARATSVVQDLIQEEHLPAKVMGAIGYGEYHPLVANDNDEHRSTNRRVVFFVKNKPEKFVPGNQKDKEKKAEEAPAEDTSETPAAAPKEPTTESEMPMPTQAPADSSQ
jgi:flagellar motor protein MotB